MEELEMALKQVKLGKARAPDGLPARYYKWFLPTLAPHFHKTVNSITYSESIPSQSLMATITVIPKEGKDSSLCSIFRPIALLITDVKLFAKIPYLRLISHLPSLIY